MLKKENGQMAEKGKTRKIRNDIIFIAALLLVLTVIGVGILAFGKTGFITGETGNLVVVTVDGEVYGTYSLNEDRTVEIVSDNGYNILVIKDGKAYVSEASCPDGVCSDHKPIRYIGATIVCLPNKVVVSIEQNESEGGNNDSGIDIIV